MVSLNATIRDKKISLEQSRKQGLLPGILYGEEIKNIPVFVLAKDFEKVFDMAGETSIIGLEVGGKKIDVLIHQISKDPVSNKVIHIDFFHPSSKKKIEAGIPLVFEGESLAVKSFGAVLMRELHEITLKGLAKDFPKEILVDISILKTIEDRITVKDLKLPKGLEISGHNLDDIVAHTAMPKEEEEMKAPEATEGEGMAAVEASDDDKKEEK